MPAISCSTFRCRWLAEGRGTRQSLVTGDGTCYGAVAKDRRMPEWSRVAGKGVLRRTSKRSYGNRVADVAAKSRRIQRLGTLVVERAGRGGAVCMGHRRGHLLANPARFLAGADGRRQPAAL